MSNQVASAQLSPPENIEDSSSACFHCGLPVTTGDLFKTVVKDEPRLFCCAGCQAVAGLIQQGGLDQFYQYRSELNQRADIQKTDYRIYDSDTIQCSFVRSSTDSVPQKTAYLLLDGITCAACVWLVEKYMSAVDGVVDVKVNAVTHQCTLVFNAEQVRLSTLMEQLAGIGYRPQPFTQAERQQQQQQQQRQLLLRLSLAGFGMMQVGMVAVALYAGAIQGIDSTLVQLFRWVSLLVATPIVLFSAQPFWASAWRNLKQRHLTMDVPVSLAIILAYLASAWATITQSGEVYFDSISMFTFFLLLGRYFEMRLRYRNQQTAGLVSQLLPMTATKVSGADQEQAVVAVTELAVGDRMRVASGETIACDGVIVEGSSAVVESLLTGEVKPVTKAIGDTVIAGTVNTDSTLLVDITAVGDQTRLSTISQLVEQAEQDKPKLQELADKVASVFVALVLIVAASVYIGWHFVDPDAALWITLSVLVVTCPCALSLATPTALTAAVAMMRRQGLLVLKGHVIETLTSITKVIFDKTGTLTHGSPTITDIDILDKNFSEADIITIAAALEEGSSHPIAAAFIEHPLNNTGKPVRARGIEITTGAGVSAVVDNVVYRLGKPDFSVQGEAPVYPKGSEETGQRLLLSKDNKPLAWVGLSDQLRDSAKTSLEQLKQSGVDIEVLSGDQAVAVKSLADELSIAYRAEQSPEKKLQVLKQEQKNHKIMMVGDGINDVPVLAGADISVAMDTATDFARTRADTVLLNNNLKTLPSIIKLAHKAKGIIKQNITWALGYNLIALPLAALGYIPPYLAAIGMSASSLIVVLNALRLYKV